MPKKQKRNGRAGKAVVAASTALAKKGKEERLRRCDQELEGKRKAAEAARPAEKPRPESARRTIKAAVIEIFRRNPGATNAELTAAIKAEFPESAFNAAHASWYRMQLKSGKLTGAKVVIPPKPKATATASSTAAN